MSQPEYFERQHKRQCGIHAINNAMQSKLVTAELMDAEVERMLAGKPAKVAQRTRTDLTGDGGFYSPSVAFSLLSRNHNYIAKPVPEYTKSGRYFVTGRKHGSYSHAIAIYNGWILDSELDHAVKLPATQYFKDTKFDVYQIYHLVPKANVRMPTQQIEIISSS